MALFERKETWQSRPDVANKYKIRPDDLNALLDHTEGWVNVKSYGATGDGTTDDTTAIRAAIAAATASVDAFEWGQGGGARVYFPRGVYLITDTITITSSAIHLVGDGVGSTAIKAEIGNTTKDAIIIGDGSGVGRKSGVAQMTIYASDASQYRDGLSLDGVWAFDIDNVAVSYANRYGFNIGGGLDGTIKQGRTRYCGVGFRIGASSADVESTTIKCLGCYAGYSATDGVQIGKAYVVSFDQLTSEFNGASGTPETSRGIVIGLDAGGSSEVTLTAPYFEGNYGWDVHVGADAAWTSKLVMTNPAFRQTANRQSGYGGVLVDRVVAGNMVGGIFSSFAAPAKSIEFTANASGFNVIGSDVPAALPPTYASGALDQYRGLIVGFDGNGDTVMRGKFALRAGGPGSGASISLTRGGAAPTTGTWAVGDLVINSSPSGGAALGWRCTTAGTPGTWETIAVPASGQPFGRVTPTHADPTVIDASLGSFYDLDVTGAPTTFVVGNPTNLVVQGQRFTLRIKNSTAGAIAVSFASSYKVATYTAPATGKSNTIDFILSASGVWVQVGPQGPDVPN